MTKPAAWMFQPLPPLLHKERPQPHPKALPLSRGRDATAPYPVARTLRYPRPIRESRGDSLRNRVAIVYAGFARHSVESLLTPLEHFCYMIGAAYLRREAAK